MTGIKIDHCVIHVSNWERSNAFYADVLGATVVPRGSGFSYKFGDVMLNSHGPGIVPKAVARIPVAPGNSDVCFEWPGPIASAVEHLAKHGIEPEVGPIATRGVKGDAISVYFRDPDGSLMEFMSYAENG